MTSDPSNSVIATRETRAMTAPQIVASLAKLEGWKLSGDGAAIAIEKTFAFPDFMKSMAFANAIAFIADRRHHHPELQLPIRHVRFSFVRTMSLVLRTKTLPAPLWWMH
jgi:4a-hydroxytetrahydrobiopterin dehydratase